MAAQRGIGVRDPSHKLFVQSLFKGSQRLAVRQRASIRSFAEGHTHAFVTECKHEYGLRPKPWVGCRSQPRALLSAAVNEAFGQKTPSRHKRQNSRRRRSQQITCKGVKAIERCRPKSMSRQLMASDASQKPGRSKTNRRRPQPSACRLPVASNATRTRHERS